MHEPRVNHSLPLFDPADPPARLLQVPGAVSRRVSSGHVLARQGDVPDRLNVLQAGAICLSSWRNSGRRAVLGILGPGDLFGLAGLWLDSNDPVEARTLLPSLTVSVPLVRLKAAMASHPDLSRWLVVWAARWHVRLERRLTLILTQPVRERVAAVLFDLAVAFGKRVPGGIRICLPVTQDLLAAMVGATRESVNRAFGSLAEAGTVRKRRGAYELCGDHLPDPGFS